MNKAAFAVSLLASNPRLLFKHLICRIKLRWQLPELTNTITKDINGVLFDFDLDYAPAIKRMFFDCYEIETVEIMRSVLKAGDTFIDVGANIGYLSAIGASFVGKKGQVHSFEPAPKYFQRLTKMAAANPDYRITVNNCALGEGRGTAKLDITSLPNIGWNTMVPNFMRSETISESVEVPVYRLDEYIKERRLDKISLIKIDTEGFEFPVLKGLQRYFENTGYLPVIICEIAPSAYPLLGYTLVQLSEYMKRYDYHAFSLINTHANVDITSLKQTTNIVFRHC
ncbi:hypothetical protein ES706_06305 [subsurface metagenome]